MGAVEGVQSEKAKPMRMEGDEGELAQQLVQAALQAALAELEAADADDQGGPTSEQHTSVPAAGQQQQEQQPEQEQEQAGVPLPAAEPTGTEQVGKEDHPTADPATQSEGSPQAEAHTGVLTEASSVSGDEVQLATAAPGTAPAESAQQHVFDGQPGSGPAPGAEGGEASEEVAVELSSDPAGSSTVGESGHSNPAAEAGQQQQQQEAGPPGGDGKDGTHLDAIEEHLDTSPVEAERGNPDAAGGPMESELERDGLPAALPSMAQPEATAEEGGSSEKCAALASLPAPEEEAGMPEADQTRQALETPQEAPEECSPAEQEVLGGTGQGIEQQQEEGGEEVAVSMGQEVVAIGMAPAAGMEELQPGAAAQPPAIEAEQSGTQGAVEEELQDPDNSEVQQAQPQPAEAAGGQGEQKQLQQGEEQCCSASHAEECPTSPQRLPEEEAAPAQPAVATSNLFDASSGPVEAAERLSVSGCGNSAAPVQAGKEEGEEGEPLIRCIPPSLGQVDWDAGDACETEGHAGGTLPPQSAAAGNSSSQEQAAPAGTAAGKPAGQAPAAAVTAAAAKKPGAKKPTGADARQVPPLKPVRLQRAGDGSAGKQQARQAPARLAPAGSSSKPQEKAAGPKPLVRPKAARPRQAALSPPSATHAAAPFPGDTAGQQQSSPTGPSSLPAPKFPTGYMDYSMEGKQQEGYRATEFEGLQWGVPRHAAAKAGSDWDSLDQASNLLPEGVPPGSAPGTLAELISQDLPQPTPAAYGLDSGAEVVADDVPGESSAGLPGGGEPSVLASAEAASPNAPAYSILHRNRSLDKKALQRGQPGYEDVEPDACFCPAPAPLPEPELELPAVAYGAPLESPSVKKTSKPTVSEILRSAGIRVKHKQQEPQGLRTAPPRQAPRDYSPPGAAVPPASFPTLSPPTDPQQGLSWGKGSALPPSGGAAGLDMAQGHPGAANPALTAHYSMKTSVSSAPLPAQQRPRQKGPSQGGPAVMAAPQDAQEYAIAASWPAYGGGHLPALPTGSPNIHTTTLPPAGRRPAKQGGSPGAWHPTASGAPPSAPLMGAQPYGYSTWQQVSAGGDPYGQQGSLPPLPGAAVPMVPAAHSGVWAQGGQVYQQQQYALPHGSPVGLQVWAGGHGDGIPFIARPSKVFHGVQARSKPKQVKYQPDGRPEFSL